MPLLVFLVEGLQGGDRRLDLDDKEALAFLGDGIGPPVEMDGKLAVEYLAFGRDFGEKGRAEPFLDEGVEACPLLHRLAVIDAVIDVAPPEEGIDEAVDGKGKALH